MSDPCKHECNYHPRQFKEYKTTFPKPCCDRQFISPALGPKGDWVWCENCGALKRTNPGARWNHPRLRTALANARNGKRQVKKQRDHAVAAAGWQKIAEKP